jgi:hypothetical protein
MRSVVFQNLIPEDIKMRRPCKLTIPIPAPGGCSQRVHGSLLAERCDISTDKAVRGLSKTVKTSILHLRTDRHPPRVNLQDVQPAITVRNTYLDLTIESAAPSHRGIDVIGAVGCSENAIIAIISTRLFFF